jgi:hypothetical protein
MESGVAESARGTRRIPPAALWIATPLVAAGLAVLYVADPTTSAFYPPCPIRAMTGFLCPGCGTTRALHALLHGESAAAFRFNPMLFVIAAALTPALVSVLRGRTPRYLAQPWFAWCAAIAIVGWWIARNV